MNGFLIVDLADLYPRQKAGGGGAADIRVGILSVCMYEDVYLLIHFQKCHFRKCQNQNFLQKCQNDPNNHI